MESKQPSYLEWMKQALEDLTAGRNLTCTYNLLTYSKLSINANMEDGPLVKTDMNLVNGEVTLEATLFERKEIEQSDWVNELVRRYPQILIDGTVHSVYWSVTNGYAKATMYFNANSVNDTILMKSLSVGYWDMIAKASKVGNG